MNLTGADSSDVVLHGAGWGYPQAILWPGWPSIAGGHIHAVEPGVSPSLRSGPEALPASWGLEGRCVLPGFTDIHVHGGGGASFASRRRRHPLGAIPIPGRCEAQHPWPLACPIPTRCMKMIKRPLRRGGR